MKNHLLPIIIFLLSVIYAHAQQGIEQDVLLKQIISSGKIRSVTEIRQDFNEHVKDDEKKIFEFNKENRKVLMSLYVWDEVNMKGEFVYDSAGNRKLILMYKPYKQRTKGVYLDSREELQYSDGRLQSNYAVMTNPVTGKLDYVLRQVRYSYDQNGLLLKETGAWTEPNISTPNGVKEYTYYPDSVVCVTSTQQKSHQQETLIKENGVIIQKKQFGYTGKLYVTYNYRYDQSGRLTEYEIDNARYWVRCPTPPPTWNYKYTYLYNEKGELAEVREVIDGKLKSIKKYSYEYF